MRKTILQILAFVFAASSVVMFAQAPKDGVFISNEDVQAVLKRAADTKRTNPDNAIRVIDMGNYQLSVSVIHRGAMGRSPAANANTAAASAANPSPACGEQRPGATGPKWHPSRRYGGNLHCHVRQRDSGHRRHNRQWETICPGQRSDHNPERSVVQRRNGGIHEPRRKNRRHHRYPGGRPARIFSDSRPCHVLEYPAGPEKGSPARICESGDQEVTLTTSPVPTLTRWLTCCSTAERE